MTRRMLRLAHRGDWRAAAENSLSAMLAAAAIPTCDGLEFDIRLSADGVPVLLHDETLQRVQGRPERVETLAAASLGAIGVPTLAAVLAAVPRRLFLDIELKDLHDRATVEVIAAGRGAGLSNAVISSFTLGTLERLGGLAPAWPRWLNADDLEPSTLATANELGCRAVSVDWHAIDASAITRARKAGLEVAAWTVRRRSVATRLEGLGILAACVEGAALDD